MASIPVDDSALDYFLRWWGDREQFEAALLDSIRDSFRGFNDDLVQLDKDVERLNKEDVRLEKQGQDADSDRRAAIDGELDDLEDRRDRVGTNRVHLILFLLALHGPATSADDCFNVDLIEAVLTARREEQDVDVVDVTNQRRSASKRGRPPKQANRAAEAIWSDIATGSLSHEQLEGLPRDKRLIGKYGIRHHETAKRAKEIVLGMLRRQAERANAGGAVVEFPQQKPESDLTA